MSDFYSNPPSYKNKEKKNGEKYSLLVNDENKPEHIFSSEFMGKMPFGIERFKNYLLLLLDQANKPRLYPLSPFAAFKKFCQKMFDWGYTTVEDNKLIDKLSLAWKSIKREEKDIFCTIANEMIVKYREKWGDLDQYQDIYSYENYKKVRRQPENQKNMSEDSKKINATKKKSIKKALSKPKGKKPSNAGDPIKRDRNLKIKFLSLYQL